MSSQETSDGSWRFLSNHTQVLLCIDGDPDARLRDSAATVGITERAAQRIRNDLIASGHLKRNRVGRRNHYSVNRSEVMRHPAQGNQDVGTLLDLLRAHCRMKGPGLG